MHHKHNTEAIVLSVIHSGESDLTVKLLTKDLGLVYARAQNALALESRMRYALQPLSHVTVSLIQGRIYWRAAGVILNKPYYKDLKKTASLSNARRALSLFDRLSAREEKNNLFIILLSALNSFLKKEIKNEDIEILFVARLLHELGYLPDDVKYSQLLKSNSYDSLITDKEKTFLIQDINSALVNSDLV